MNVYVLTDLVLLSISFYPVKIQLKPVWSVYNDATIKDCTFELELQIANLVPISTERKFHFFFKHTYCDSFS